MSGAFLILVSPLMPIMNDEAVIIEVFAVLCAKCKRMEIVVHRAVDELPDIPVEIIRKTDVFELKERGVTANPALIIEGVIVAQGVVPSVEETKNLIIAAAAKKKLSRSGK